MKFRLLKIWVDLSVKTHQSLCQPGARKQKTKKEFELRTIEARAGISDGVMHIKQNQIKASHYLSACLPHLDTDIPAIISTCLAYTHNKFYSETGFIGIR